MFIVLLVPGCQVWPNSIRKDALEVFESLFQGVDALAWSSQGTCGDHQAIYMVEMCMSDEEAAIIASAELKGTSGRTAVALTARRNISQGPRGC
jgi:hypothetical protein